MSWVNYVKQNLMEYGKMNCAGIYGLDGNPWASDGDTSLTPEEVQRLVRVIKGEQLRENEALTVGGNKYLKIQMDEQEGTLVMKQLTGAEKDKKTACIFMGKTFLCFGAVNGPAGCCNTHVNSLGSYLKDAGY